MLCSKLHSKAFICVALLWGTRFRPHKCFEEKRAQHPAGLYSTTFGNEDHNLPLCNRCPDIAICWLHSTNRTFDKYSLSQRTTWIVMNKNLKVWHLVISFWFRRNYRTFNLIAFRRDAFILGKRIAQCVLMHLRSRTWSGKLLSMLKQINFCPPGGCKPLLTQLPRVQFYAFPRIFLLMLLRFIDSTD